MINNPPRVTFYKVKDNQGKIQLICAKANEAVAQEKRLLIAVSNLEAAQYIDTLLWKFTPESFIPHVVTMIPTQAWIAITTANSANLNQAPRLLNLSTHAHPLSHQFEEIYELYDETHPDKKALSDQRMAAYKASGALLKGQGT